MKKLLSMLVASQILLGCSSSGVVGPSQEDDKATLQMMWQEILDLVEDRSCDDSSECAAIAAGSKPCGGPWLYLIYSRPNVDEELLKSKLDELNTFEHVYNQTHHILSDCAVPSRPDPGCVELACVDTRPGP